MRPCRGSTTKAASTARAICSAPAKPRSCRASRSPRRIIAASPRLAKSRPRPDDRNQQRRPLRRQRHQSLQHHCRDPGTDPRAGYVHGRRASRQLGGGRRCRRQWRGHRDDHGGSAHPFRQRHPAEAHDPLRALDRRGTGPARQPAPMSKAISRRAARRATRSLTGLARYYGWSNRWPITPQARLGRSRRLFQPRQWLGQDSAASMPRTTRLSCRSSRDWLAPFAGMGAKDVVIRKTGGTDHVFMQAVGVPGFQFIQDPLDYGSRVHHTSIDTLRPSEGRRHAPGRRSSWPRSSPTPPMPTRRLPRPPLRRPSRS